MTPHERDLILKVADEVRAADRTVVDPEAERVIRAEVAAQSHAAYILTQRVIVQDLALQQARARLDELEGRHQQAGLPTGGPAGGGPAPAGGRSGVGDFLRTAAAAAAGTIGGQLIYDGLRHWAVGHGGGEVTRPGPDVSSDDQGWGGAVESIPGVADAAPGVGGDWGGEGQGAGGGADWGSADAGSGGDWGNDQAEPEEEEESEENAADEDAGGGDDWGDASSDSSDPAPGSGGDW